MGPIGAISWPILERIPLGGEFAVSPHGIGIAVGFAVGAWLMIRRAEKRGLGHTYIEDISDEIQQMLGRAAIGAILGARLGYVLTHLDVYGQDPIAILRVWEGGLTFLGGVVGAVGLALPWGIKRGYRGWQAMDSAMPGIAAGLAIGRIGDLMIGDHVGAPTNFALGWRCKGDYWTSATNSFGFNAPDAYPLSLPVPTGADLPTVGCFDTVVHQTALYDLLAALFVLLLLLWLERQPRFDGFFVAAWIYGYGVVRFVGDFARQDRRFLGLTGSQYALMAAVAVVTVWLVRRRPWRDRPWAWDLEFAHPWLSPDEPTSGEASGSTLVAEAPADETPDPT